MSDADRSPADQIGDAREHLADARYFAGELGGRRHDAVAEIDRALLLLYAARERLVIENVRRDRALLAQLDAFDTYRDNIVRT